MTTKEIFYVKEESDGKKQYIKIPNEDYNKIFQNSRYDTDSLPYRLESYLSGIHHKPPDETSPTMFPTTGDSDPSKFTDDAKRHPLMYNYETPYKEEDLTMEYATKRDATETKPLKGSQVDLEKATEIYFFTKKQRKPSSQSAQQKEVANN